MDPISFEEIVCILAKNGRPDLIQEFKEFIKVDEDFKPKLIRRDSLSDTEGSAEEESIDFVIDDAGFHSLK
jgi:hypothetical protein|tara:strand:- start:28 stop:240 length:213 start_codon:yes stop_codon:yes gene_type:complete